MIPETYVNFSLKAVLHTRRYTTHGRKPIVLHGIVKARQARVKIFTGGTVAEFTASLFYDVIHEHERRWLFRSHLTNLLGLPV